jgi:predicted component of type VI protein secretion system
MAEISDTTLMLSIQAVGRAIRDLEQNRRAVDGPESADLDEMIETYEIAAMELRRAYEAARTASGNLPPYGSLLLGTGG